MILATTSGEQARFDNTVEKRIVSLYNAGFRHIDLSMYCCKTYDTWIMQDDWKEHCHKLLYLTDSLGMDFVQAHSQGGNPFDASEHDFILEATIRSLEVCKELGIPMTVAHAGYELNISKEEFYARNAAFYRELFPIMERTGVKVLTENSTKCNMGNERYYFLNGKDMFDFAEYLGHPLFGGCWDTGHANCEGHQYEDLIDLGKYLCAVHINDNRGHGDEHIAPWCGTTSFDDVMHGLIDAGFKGPFTLECDSTLRAGTSWQGHRHGSTRDTRLFEPSAALQALQEKMLYAAGKELLDAYGLFEA